ncbi:MAG: hypothetical protein J0M08_01175 [Bacteroidetes bacterium]|nr:hypothetical protein [Bacteroidota bacterium]
MNTLKKIILGIFTTTAITAVAQTEVDALRYSMLNYKGSARYTAMGGAFGALGADLSSITINPAGLGVMNKSEFNFTPTLILGNTNSTYNNSTGSDSRLGFNFSSLGLAIARMKNPAISGNWVNTNFAIGFNKINNFHNRAAIIGESNGSTYLDAMRKNANGTNPMGLNSFAEGLAFETYLLDTVSGTTDTYYTPIPSESNLDQSKLISTRGSMGEFYIAVGANYANRLYLGGSINIVSVRYEEEFNYQESDTKDSIAGFKGYVYSGELSTRGTGFNAKFGAIYRPADWVRIGASIQTPTYIGLKDNYNNEMAASYDNGVVLRAQSPQGEFDYRLTTPFRVNTSLAFVVLKNALLSVDHEFVDYSMAKLNSMDLATVTGGYSFRSANTNIQQMYTTANNFRVGAEVRLDPITLRAGYGLLGNPYKSSVANNGMRTNYAFGVGYRQDSYYLDFAYSVTQQKDTYYMYTGTTVNPAKNKMSASVFMATLGFKF